MHLRVAQFEQVFDPRSAVCAQPSYPPRVGPDELRADCSRCSGLCCVALPFAVSADFPVDKAAGTPCRNLLTEFGCGIHAELRPRGWVGCTVYDCFGAGQQVTQHTYGGRTWRESPELAREVFEVFPVVRQLHEMLRHLLEAEALVTSSGLSARLAGQVAELVVGTRAAARLAPPALLRLDVGAHRSRVGPVLGEVSAAVRAQVRRRPPGRRHADLAGAVLVRSDLRAADLRGAYLIAADLSGADLRRADLLGTDLRDARLGGADLTGALFLTQPQVDSAHGDAATQLPDGLLPPSHWPGRG